VVFALQAKLHQVMDLRLAALFSASSEGAAAPSEGLEATLRAMAVGGRSAWPGVSLDDAPFVRHLAERTQGDGEALRSICTADMFLACACKEGDRAAVRSLDRVYLSRVPEYLRTMRPSPDFSDEVRQVLSEKLLVGSAGAPPKIAEYSGRGPLAAWLRVAAVRTALNLRQRRTEEAEAAGIPVARALTAGASPELDYVRRRYAGAFVEALRAAFGALSEEHRRVLRLHFARGFTGDQIAQTLQVHRATVVRWIRRAREDVLREAMRRLRESARVSDEEHASLLRALESQLELSCSQLLGSD
jgi:RNA polymerase sigma-70 factor (ECF subfamily)